MEFACTSNLLSMSILAYIVKDERNIKVLAPLFCLLEDLFVCHFELLGMLLMVKCKVVTFILRRFVPLFKT